MGPWRTEEVETLSSEAGLPLVVDEGGRVGASLGGRRAPIAVFILDGAPLARLDWPFTERELLAGLAALAEAPRAGPWRHLGEAVPLGVLTSLDGASVDLDALSRTFLISFFNPLCPPCWDVLPVLVELGEKILVVLAVTVPDALSQDERERLRGTGLVIVLDDAGELAQTLAVRVSLTYVIVGQEGVIRWVQEGVAEPEELRSKVVALLSMLGKEGKDK